MDASQAVELDELQFQGSLEDARYLVMGAMRQGGEIEDRQYLWSHQELHGQYISPHA